MNSCCYHQHHWTLLPSCPPPNRQPATVLLHYRRSYKCAQATQRSPDGTHVFGHRRIRLVTTSVLNAIIHGRTVGGRRKAESEGADEDAAIDACFRPFPIFRHRSMCAGSTHMAIEHSVHVLSSMSPWSHCVQQMYMYMLSCTMSCACPCVRRALPPSRLQELGVRPAQPQAMRKHREGCLASELN